MGRRLGRSHALPNMICIYQCNEYDHLKTRNPSFKGTPMSEILELEKQADALREEGKYDEAVAKLNELLEKDPTFVRAHLGLAVLYHHTKDYEKSVQHGEKANELEPNDPFNIAALSVTYQRALAATGDMRYKEKAEEMLFRNHGTPNM